MNSDMQTKKQSNMVTPQGLFLCAILFAVLGFAPIIPSQISRLLRPAFVLVCIMLTPHINYRMGATKWILINLLYLTIVLAKYPLTESSVSSYISMAAFFLFLIVASNKVWTRKEIAMIMNVVIIACTIQAIIIVFSNPGVFRESGNQHIKFLGQTVNRNPISFAIVSGAICAFVSLFYNRYDKRGFSLIFNGICALICTFTVFVLGCRSAFWATTLGIILVCWQTIRDEKDPKTRSTKRFIFIVALVFVGIIGMHVSSGTYSARLFDVVDEEGFGSGRDKIWEEAWTAIKLKPLFGGGFDYWEQSGGTMGTHNTFLLYMLYGGAISGFMLVMFFISTFREIWQSNNLVPFALSMEALFHSISETDLDYYGCIPLILALIVARYLQSKHCNMIHLFKSS